MSKATALQSFLPKSLASPANLTGRSGASPRRRRVTCSKRCSQAPTVERLTVDRLRPHRRRAAGSCHIHHPRHALPHRAAPTRSLDLGRRRRPLPARAASRHLLQAPAPERPPSSSPELASNPEVAKSVSPAGEAAPSRTSDIDFDWDASPEKKADAAEAPGAATERSSEAQKTDAEDKPAAKQPSQPDAEAKPAETAPSKANGEAAAAKAASLEVDVEDDDDESEKTTLYAQPIGEDDDEEDEEPTFVGDKSKVNGAEKSDPNSASGASRPPGGLLEPLPASLLSAPRTPPPPPPPTPAKSVPPPAPRSNSSPSLRSVPPPSVPSHAEVLPVSSTSPIALGRTTMPTFPPTSVGAPRRTGQIALLAVLVGGLLGLAIVLVARPNALALGSGGTGALIVTVSGPGNAPVSRLTVFADDVSRCEASPCRIAELKGGTHFVRVSAPGYEATAARAVSVNAGNEDTLHIQLSRASEPSEEPVKRAAAAAPEPAAGRGTTSRRTPGGRATGSDPCCRRKTRGGRRQARRKACRQSRRQGEGPHRRQRQAQHQLDPDGQCRARRSPRRSNAGRGAERERRRPYHRADRTGRRAPGDVCGRRRWRDPQHRRQVLSLASSTSLRAPERGGSRVSRHRPQTPSFARHSPKARQRAEFRQSAFELTTQPVAGRPLLVCTDSTKPQTPRSLQPVVMRQSAADFSTHAPPSKVQ